MNCEYSTNRYNRYTFCVVWVGITDWFTHYLKLCTFIANSNSVVA